MAFGEAYMDGRLVVEGDDIYDFLNLCFANMGWSNGPLQINTSPARLSR
jgi:cyclopropane-fatty-acyl-phospholipid synthase